jgi:hypothetical protein
MRQNSEGIQRRESDQDRPNCRRQPPQNDVRCQVRPPLQVLSLLVNLRHLQKRCDEQCETERDDIELIERYIERFYEDSLDYCFVKNDIFEL